MTYPCVISKGHYLAEIDGKFYVVDTGSPVSFSFCGLEDIQINGVKARFFLMQPANREETEALVEHPVDGFIGMDFLQKFGYLYIDRERKEIAFENCWSGDRNALNFQCKSILIETRVLVDAVVEGTKTICILDTGAWESYVDKTLMNPLPVVRVLQDYNPGTGNITANVKEPEICIGHLMQKWPVGEMPPLVQRACDLYGARGVLGIDRLFKNKILFDFNEGEIYTDK